MRWFTNLITGFRSLFNQQRVESELDEELDSYVEASAAHKQQLGMTPEAARHAAAVELGSRNAVKHRVWSSRWESLLEGLLWDFRLSIRSLARSPGFAVVALLSLALGIGANTAIFTLMEQILLRNLPVHDPQQLVTFGRSDSAGIGGGIDLGAYGYFPWYFARQLQAAHGPFQGIASYCSFSQQVSVRTPGAADDAAAVIASANLVSGNYFHVLGARPLIGRAITPADDVTPGSGAVAVLSYHFWQNSLSSDPSILGKTIRLNGTPFEVIGVMPQAFHGIKLEMPPTDLWTPTTMQQAVLPGQSLLTPQSGLYFMHVFARLSPEAAKNHGAFEQSQQWLNHQVRAGIRATEGTSISPGRQHEINRVTVPLLSAVHGVSLMRSQYGESLRILMGVVILVLLIACANLANFLLARTAGRQHEIATRLALGSGRARIVRQSLIEALLLSLAGGLLGLGIAFGAARALLAFLGQGRPYTAMSSRPDLTVLFFTIAVSLLTGIFFGLAPALRAARTTAAGALSAGARTVRSGGGKSSRFWPKALVVGQVMLSLLLLVGAGLFLRTLHNLQGQDYGFNRTDLLLADYDAILAGYKPSQTAALHQRLLQHLSVIPGVRSAALAATPPISNGTWSSNVSLSGYTPAPKENMVSILNRVSGDYFETAGIAIVAGRAITPEDTLHSLKVAVVNQTLARRYFPRGDAIGHSLTIGIDSVKGPWQIVGIARDTKSGDPRDTAPVRMTYIPLAQINPFLPATATAGTGVASSAAPSAKNQPTQNNDCYAHVILVRTTGNPSGGIAGLRDAVAAVDPNLPLLNIRTIHQDVSRMLSDDELNSGLTAVFALLALMLAAIGLCGVMSYNVVQRTSEIGVRLALGAQTEDVLWMVLREALMLLAIGVGLGMPLSLGATRLVRNQLFGLRADDPITYVMALAVIAAIVVMSAWIPARRAAAVNPVDALRCE